MEIMMGCIDKIDQPAGLRLGARPPGVFVRALALHERDARAYINSALSEDLWYDSGRISPYHLGERS